jgi:hypothetical protein
MNLHLNLAATLPLHWVVLDSSAQRFLIQLHFALSLRSSCLSEPAGIAARPFGDSFSSFTAALQQLARSVSASPHPSKPHTLSVAVSHSPHEWKEQAAAGAASSNTSTAAGSTHQMRDFTHSLLTFVPSACNRDLSLHFVHRGTR